jgi:hypothetical protein
MDPCDSPRATWIHLSCFVAQRITPPLDNSVCGNVGAPIQCDPDCRLLIKQETTLTELAVTVSLL